MDVQELNQPTGSTFFGADYDDPRQGFTSLHFRVLKSSIEEYDDLKLDLNIWRKTN